MITDDPLDELEVETREPTGRRSIPNIPIPGTMWVPGWEDGRRVSARARPQRGEPRAWTLAEVVSVVEDPREVWPAGSTVTSEKKESPLWSFAQFKDGHRARQNFKTASALVIDYDADPLAKDISKVGNLDLDPGALAECWGRWIFLAHTSASHDPEKEDRPWLRQPRWRVLLPLSRPITDAAEYARLGAWATRHGQENGAGGLEKDTSWHRVEQPFYVPARWEWARDAYASVVEVNRPLLDVDACLEELAAWEVCDEEESPDLEQLRWFAQTDIGNAERLVWRHGRDLRFCQPWGGWLAWDNKRWRRDDTGEPMRRAKGVARDLVTVADELEADDADAAADFRKYGLRCQSAGKLRSMLELAESEPGIPVLPAQLDIDPWALVVDNGTLDLRTSRLRPHRRADLLTKASPYTYDPAAPCPTWRRFVSEIMCGRADLVEFLQRAAGYSLTAMTNEQVFFFLYGDGSNGKSTFLTTMMLILSEYGFQGSQSVIEEGRNEAHPTVLADLFGKRLCCVAETKNGGKLSEEQVKRITGDEPIWARRMGMDGFTFEPTHKLWVAGNYKPVITGTDLGIWRRLCMVPFDASFTKEQKDPLLPMKLRAELPGILAWMVEGARKWHESGLTEPEVIRTSRQEYQTEMDRIGGFLDEWCVLDPQQRVRSSHLYKAYQGWALEQGMKSMNRNRFGREVTKRGLEKRKSGGIWYRSGVGIISSSEREG